MRLLAAVVILALVCGTALWFWIGPGSSPLVGACDVAESAGTSDAPIVFEPTIDWRSADLPEAATDEDEQVMLAAASLDHGWVATGRSSSGGDSTALVLGSTDGTAWQTHPGTDAQFADAEVRHLAEHGSRVMAAGSVSADSMPSAVWGTGVWVGRAPLAWQVVRGPFEGFTPTALAAGERTVLLLGMSVGRTGTPAAWSSRDGVTWNRLDLRLPVAPELVSFGALRPDEDGWLAVGSISRGADASAAPIVWTSPDGAAWSCRILDAAGFEVARPTGLYRSAQGWLATGIAADVCGSGASCVAHTIAWTSPDGVRWSPGRTGIEPWHSGGIAVAGSAEGFVAVGHGTTWWSADGDTWVELADGGSGALALAGQPDALVMTDDGRLLAAGTTYDGTDADAWIATGFLAR